MTAASLAAELCSHFAGLECEREFSTRGKRVMSWISQRIVSARVLPMPGTLLSRW